MMPLINLALRSEFSFRQTYGKVTDLIPFGTESGFLGIADINNTFSHIYLEKQCKENGIKPIFGVRLEVVKGAKNRVRGKCGPFYIFLAKNDSGLQELYQLVTTAWENFYYKPMLDWEDLQNVSENIFVISENIESEELRLDYLALSPSTPKILLDLDVPKVYINNNFFPRPEHRKIYQLITGVQKRGDDYYSKFETKRAFQHILSSEEFYRIYSDNTALENTYKIAESCNATLKKASMVKYHGKAKIQDECEKGAKKKGINLKFGEYAERYKREIQLIEKKNYTDYFLIVSDIVNKAKKTMLVGPARGSAAGSLVCYLLGITEVDPLKFGLVFERFIDINREDLPDIDIDFPDENREKVVKSMFKTYGENKVCHIANINFYGSKSAVNDAGSALKIPKFEIEALKENIVDKSLGDFRDVDSIKNTLETTDFGKAFVSDFPSIKFASYMQNHATHSGKHAAGIIVCDEKITNFGGINKKDGTIMMDKKGAEYLNLLKIDALGLRTLSVLQEAAKMTKMDYKDFYNLPLDDEKTFSMFKEMRLNGIFQFEGAIMRNLCEKMSVDDFNDIVALTALARPGPLHSGGADKFIKRKMGFSEIEFACDNEKYKEITGETFGTLVYQEQIMNICRHCAGMDWPQVSEIRKLVAKSKGAESFSKHKKDFISGCKKNNIKENEAEIIWESMLAFGSYAMNKSHTVSYGLISYWCAYMKAHFPLEFLIANLKNNRTEDSALKILRDAVENDGIEYLPVDPDNSGLDWEIINGKVVGGLQNIKGIGEKKAIELLAARNGERKFTHSMLQTMMNPITPYDSIYPCRDKYGDIYENFREYGLSFPPSFIKDIKKDGTYVFLGKVTRKFLKDFNEYNELIKRKGKRYHENCFSLKLTIEDDTGQINCNINRFKFDGLNGDLLAKELIVDESYVIIRGTLSTEWKIVNVDQIFDLKELEK